MKSRKFTRKFIIEKQDTTATTATSDYIDDYDEYYSDTEDVTSSIPIRKRKDDKVFTSIVNTDYRKPVSGSKQDNFTRDDILKRLVDYIPLKTMKEKQILQQLPVFKTWIRYYNVETKQFRTGGLLMKVSYPDYIMLVNTSNNISWSVQLKDNIIYIPDPRKKNVKNDQKTQKEQKEKEQKDKENLIKEKLYDMYQKGKLTTKNN